MFPITKYCDVIKYGEYRMSYEIEQCNRCYRSDVKEYVSFKNIKLCLKCIDSINKTKPTPIPLVTMRQDMYLKNDYINEIINNFKIIDRISPKEFKVMINNSIRIMHHQEIKDKYWDYLSFCDKEYIINLD
jgi:hypothetical protein